MQRSRRWRQGQRLILLFIKFHQLWIELLNSSHPHKPKLCVSNINYSLVWIHSTCQDPFPCPPLLVPWMTTWNLKFCIDTLANISHACCDGCYNGGWLEQSYCPLSLLVNILHIFLPCSLKSLHQTKWIQILATTMDGWKLKATLSCFNLFRSSLCFPWLGYKSAPHTRVNLYPRVSAQDPPRSGFMPPQKPTIWPRNSAENCCNYFSETRGRVPRLQLSQFNIATSTDTS